MTKLYRLNMERAKGLNIGQFNPTCKAILKGMYRLEKEHNDTDYSGSTGADILSYCVENRLWSTRQDPTKYHTTWAYYVKLLKDKAGVFESGTLKGDINEFLEEFLDPDDVPQEFEDDLQEDEAETAEATSDDDEAELQRMIEEEAQQMAAE